MDLIRKKQHNVAFFDIINNLNSNVININETSILEIQGSFRYKPSNFPSFSQKESILFI